mgnify:CR=1 FL=1
MSSVDTEPVQNELDAESAANKAYIEQFNARADAARRALGIDPSQCLRLVGIEGSEFASLHEYFAGLEQRKFTTPLVGKNRRHDLWHEPQIENSHPDLVDLIVRIAERGTESLRDGNVPLAESMMHGIEVALGAPQVSPRATLLTALLRSDPLFEGDPAQKVDEVLVTQQQYLVDYAAARIAG